MKTNHQTSRRRIASMPPYNEIATTADHAIEDGIDACRSRHPGARIEVHRIDHQPACNSNDGRRCDCQPIPVVIIDGREWLRLLADGSEEPVDQTAPHPAWLDAPEGHLLLAATMPLADWLRLEFCPTVATIIGDGDTARFHGEPIDAELTRRLRRLERHQERRPLLSL